MTDKIENTETSPEQESKTPAKKSVWKYVVCIISAVIILPIFLLILILTTGYGQKTTIELVDKLMDSLTITKVSGDLQQGLLLEGIRYQSKGVDTLIPKANLQLNLSCLLKRKVCLQDFSVDNPQININTALIPKTEDKEKRSTTIHKINLPIFVEANNIEVNNLNVLIDNNQINLNKFQTSFTLNNETGLTLPPTIIDQLIIQSKQINKKENINKTLTTKKQPIDWQKLEQQLTPALLSNVEKIDLPFDVHIEDIKGTNWQYQLIDGKNIQNILIPNVQLQADASDYIVQLKKLNIESSIGNINGQGQLLLKDNFPLEFNINTDIHEQVKNKQILLPKTQANLVVSGALKKQTKINLITNGITDASFVGTLNFNQPKTPLDFTLVSDNLQYPIDKKAKNPLIIKNINANIKGDLLNYNLTLAGNFGGMGVPNSKIDSTIDGTISSIDIQKLILKTLQGTTSLQGQVSWKEGIIWQSSLNLDSLNFSSYLSQFPAILSGKLTSNGQLNGENWLVNIPTIDVAGIISKQPVTLKGNVNLSPEKLLEIPELLLHYGNNEISAKGYLSKKSDLNINIEAPDLTGLLPNLSATLFGNIKLAGKATEPNLNAHLKGRNIKYKDIRLSNIDLVADINSDQIVQGNINLDMKDFSYNDIKINLLKLSANGSEKDHHLELKSQGDPIALNLNLSGKFDRTSQTWKGILSGINMDSPIGKWVTNKNINIDYDNTLVSANINSHCWKNSDIDLCFPETFKVGKNGVVPFDIKKINLGIINELIKKDILDGTIQSQGTIAWASDHPLDLKMQIKGNNISTKYKIDYRTFKLDIPKLELTANLNHNDLNIESDINIEKQGKIFTNILLKDLTNERRLSGSLKMTGVNLNLVNQLLSNREKVNGDVIANLTFAGTLNKPLLNGSFNIDNINTKVKTLPFDIDDGKLNLAFQGNHSTLDGNIKTSDSQLNLTGNASWNNLEDWKTALKIDGDKFNVNIPSIAKLKITPNIQITANPRVLELSGLVDIPWARIEIDSLPDTAVPISEDEIVLDGPNKSKELKIGRAPIAAKTKSGIEIRSDLKINIGDDVALNAYGLNTQLNGLLSVQQNKGNLGLFGQIYLKNGRYASFGQDLLIKRGIISFSGEPSQPMLNIRAIRNPSSMENSNITAGVNIVGIATKPEVTVFAQPSTSQAEALSYLLTGRSLTNANESGSSGSIGAALLGLTLSKNGKLLGGIGEAFGIQDLNLGTSGAGNSSKVEVSGYITPRLQAKYGIGLFDGLAEFTLRYRLLPQLYLQSVSGVNQAVDLLYEFEF